MARCPYCGATIANGTLPCPYCDGLTGRAPQQVSRRFCARCGEDVTAVRTAWCPGCGFRIHAVEAPPAAPAAPARPGGAGRFLLGLLLLAVGALLVAQAVPWVSGTLGPWGADPSIHVPAAVPTGAPGYSARETGVDARELAYTVRGHAGTVPVTLYRGVYDAMPDRVVGYVGDDEGGRYRRVIEEPSGRPYIRDLAATIAAMTDEPDDRARIAVSLVQHLDYDDARAAEPYYGVRYPYETLYLERGVCSDKSVLLAALLGELGFGVALFQFDAENHMAVGLLCPAGYDHRGTGYAFVESTAPSIMTDAEGDYIGARRLVSAPAVIPVAEGLVFASIGTEAKDAAEWTALRGMGPTLDPYHYGRWETFSRAYGIVPKKG